MYFYFLFDLFKLCHHIFIDVKSSGCIEDHEVVAILLRMFDRCPGDIRRLVVLSHGEDFHTLLLTIDL